MGEEWQNAKAEVVDFFDAVRTVDKDGKLIAALGEYWWLSQTAFNHLLANHSVQGGLAARRDVQSAWRASRKRVRSAWTAIESAETELEDLVRQAYRVPAGVYADTVARATPITSKDLLLPR